MQYTVTHGFSFSAVGFHLRTKLMFEYTCKDGHFDKYKHLFNLKAYKPAKITPFKYSCGLST